MVHGWYDQSYIVFVFKHLLFGSEIYFEVKIKDTFIEDSLYFEASGVIPLLDLVLVYYREEEREIFLSKLY